MNGTFCCDKQEKSVIFPQNKTQYNISGIVADKLSQLGQFDRLDQDL